MRAEQKLSCRADIFASNARVCRQCADVHAGLLVIRLQPDRAAAPLHAHSTTNIHRASSVVDSGLLCPTLSRMYMVHTSQLSCVQCAENDRERVTRVITRDGTRTGQSSR